MKLRALALCLLLAPCAAALPLPAVDSVTGVGHVINSFCPDAYALVVHGAPVVGGEGWGFVAALADDSLPMTCGLVSGVGPDYAGSFDPAQGGCLAGGAGDELCLLNPSSLPGQSEVTQYDVVLVVSNTPLVGAVEALVL